MNDIRLISNSIQAPSQELDEMSETKFRTTTKLQENL
jgi:hypothetical protein